MLTVLRRNWWQLLLRGLIAISFGTALGQMREELHNYFQQYVGLSDGQIADVSKGTVFVKELQSPDPAEIILFGTVFVDSSPENCLKLIRNIDMLRKLPNYLAIQQFSTPPQLSDMVGFTLDAEDIEDLRVCIPGNCKVQLPAEVMDTFKNSIDWSAKDLGDQVNNLAQKMALEALVAYQQGGNYALGAYRDKKNPIRVSETFQELVSQIKSLPVYLPEFRDYLLRYPDYILPNVEDQFYWEKITFGLKPTLRLIHAVFYPNPGGGLAFVYALKQLYSSHYFHTAVDLTACTKAADQAGFFLITVKASKQAGLTGVKGSVIRNTAVGRAQKSLESALAGIKKTLENQAVK
jgi:hypothetical protein